MALTAQLRDLPPSLESGDRLTASEFHRRYTLRTDILKAELIEGVVYVASPTHLRGHSTPQGMAVTWLGAYAARHESVDVAPEATVRLDDRNEVRPDAILFRAASGGGSAREVDDYLFGAPELIVEIAGSSAAIDLHEKSEAYRRAGVQEYIAWRVFDEAIDWWELRGGDYVALDGDAEGVVRSKVFPGLVLKPADLLAGDLAAVLALQRA
jgi:Uma2 family endonuclease